MNERDMNDYTASVVGGPPENFNELMRLGEQIHRIAMETLGVPNEIPDEDVERHLANLRDATLLASFAYTWKKTGRIEDQHPVAWITRAKQIVQWCKRPFATPTPLNILEHKAREMGRVIAERMFNNESAVLVLSNVDIGTGPKHSTFISTADRDTTIALLDELVQKMKSGQRGLA